MSTHPAPAPAPEARPLAEPDPHIAFRDTPLGRNVVAFVSSPVALVASVVFLTIVVMAVLAPWIALQDPYDLTAIDIMDARLAPGAEGWAGTWYPLGTDRQGRDMYSAILHGLRTSLIVASTSGVIALAIGITVGLSAAYFGGRLESLLMRIVDVQLSFPAILIALVMLAVLGRGIDKVIAALVFVQWAYYARTVRGAAMSELSKEYMEAARCLALSTRVILFSHLLPNALPPVIVVATMQIASAIAIEATLSFLGLGLPVTEPSLGLLISNGFDVMMSGYYWISIFPGLALLVTVMSVNLMGDRLRDILNPRHRR